jgi:TonB family protein
VDKKPEVVKAEYPKPRRGLMSAETYVAIVVGIDGSVEQAELAKSSDEEYGRQSLEAAKRYKFKPAMKSGLPVRCVVILPLGFTTRIRTEIR